MADTGVAVIGAGVVGLAVAARLARDGDVVVLERRARHGQETSSRNSEVIHGGMYYPTGSLKARLCVEGNRRLYELCATRRVPHARCGKVITATSAGERGALEALLALGLANGVEMRWLSAEETLALEPRVRTVGSLLSPNTGIVSAHGLMDCLLHVAQEKGALLQPRAEVVALDRDGGGRDWRLTVRSGTEEETLTAERVVNAAGLEADTVAGLAGIDVEAAGYRQHYWKGSYFSVRPAKASVVSRLVYPVPDHVSLGVHAVIGLEGRLRFGPDAEYLADRKTDYGVAESKRAAFATAVRRLVPEIEDEDLAPDMAGIRPKLQGPGQGVRDFVVAEESGRGMAGLVNLVGIDSPGLTAALAIADEVARLLAGPGASPP
ncbi:MAG TPA: NAD(P)/FAD-dependent oxidoreductase [Vicinamibacteria bacterium]|nr:NAD(P)/FAD-dependent oxidoreductase [Vicinamibacteria bacterium]